MWLRNLLQGWSDLEPNDRITVLAAPDLPFPLPPGVETSFVRPTMGGPIGAMWSRSIGVRNSARRLGADAVLSGVTASALAGTHCPRGVVLHDLRHELRPHQFGLVRRLARRVTYGWSFRTADHIFCVSHRTRLDLVSRHPGTKHRAVVARNGADHVDLWPGTTPRRGQPYALAFGHFTHKNVDAVLDAWAEFCLTDEDWSLRLVGLGPADRDTAIQRVDMLGIADRVELMPWIDEDEFVTCFTGAGLVILPSDFEGFGLPAVEALRLRIPLVVSADQALAEVTGQHAQVSHSLVPGDLVDSMRRALAQSQAELDAGRAYTDQFTWRAVAHTIRGSLLEASGKHSMTRPPGVFRSMASQARRPPG